MQKKVLIPLANGTEEIEAIAVIDVLRRAGAEVTIAAVAAELTITAAHGVKIVADKLLMDCKEEQYDLIVLPGGMPGAEYLRDSIELTTMLKQQRAANRLYAAICAAPAVVLQSHGLLDGVKSTCYPSLLPELENGVDAKIVVDNNCITSQGPGTTLEFALKLVELLFDEAAAENLAQQLLVAA